ncbi:myelin and lymphocyte protein [Gastrophryne carolinensis]
MATPNNAPPIYADASPLPSGVQTIATFPDLLMILEFVFGGLVWILIASSRVPNPEAQGWVMFVSVTCFVFTTLLLLLYCGRAHGGKSTWTTIDAFYNFIAALFYLSASVIQAYNTILLGRLVIAGDVYKFYQENIAAVVFAYLATLVYTIHAVASLIRWKRSP